MGKLEKITKYGILVDHGESLSLGRYYIVKDNKPERITRKGLTAKFNDINTPQNFSAYKLPYFAIITKWVRTHYKSNSKFDPRVVPGKNT